MTASGAWLILADRAQSSVTNDDEQLVICQALRVAAESFGREAQTRLAEALAKNDRLQELTLARMSAQTDFLAILKPEGSAK